MAYNLMHPGRKGLQQAKWSCPDGVKRVCASKGIPCDVATSLDDHGLYTKVVKLQFSSQVTSDASGNIVIFAVPFAIQSLVAEVGTLSATAASDYSDAASRYNLYRVHSFKVSFHPDVPYDKFKGQIMGAIIYPTVSNSATYKDGFDTWVENEVYSSKHAKNLAGGVTITYPRPPKTMMQVNGYTSDDAAGWDLEPRYIHYDPDAFTAMALSATQTLDYRVSNGTLTTGQQAYVWRPFIAVVGRNLTASTLIGALYVRLEIEVISNLNIDNGMCVSGSSHIIASNDKVNNIERVMALFKIAAAHLGPKVMPLLNDGVKALEDMFPEYGNEIGSAWEFFQDAVTKGAPIAQSIIHMFAGLMPGAPGGVGSHFSAEFDSLISDISKIF